MSGDELWIEVVNWERYQHRDTARSGVPPWIKVETALMSSPDFESLTTPEAGLLVCIWLEYARSQRRLSGDPLKLSRSLGRRATKAQLKTLSDAGFIRLVARRPSRVLPAGEGEEKGEESLENVLQAVSSRAHTRPDREHRPYDPPSDPLGHLRRLVANGVIADLLDLDAELRALDLPELDARRVRAEAAAMLAPPNAQEATMDTPETPTPTPDPTPGPDPTPDDGDDTNGDDDE